MPLPATRIEFKDYCLRKLGQGAITINVTDEQVEDRIDEALEHFHEYHDEGTERIFLEVVLTSGDIQNKYLEMPSDIIGVTGFIPNPGGSASQFWDVEYQYMFSNAHEIANANMRYFYVAMMHLESIYQMFDYHTAIRYNRVVNRVYIDDDWKDFAEGEFIIFDAYRVVDAEQWARTWGNKWLRDYATALIKKQWGDNLAKYSGIQMIGGTTFDAQRLIDEANNELERLEEQVKVTETAPLGIFIG